ncbi:hypothetical protein JCM15519_08400 [Fundidesulfovibrio butyratiphilus]
MTRTVCITLGDPNGLGPELVCRWLAQAPKTDERLVLIGPEAGLAAHSERLGLGTPWTRVARPEGDAPGVYLFEPNGLATFTAQPGVFSEQGGLAAGLSLEAACAMLLSGQAQALVTCPLNKAGLQMAGFDFPGHTEFLAARAGLPPDGVCMHLCGPRLRVSLVTTHHPLADIPALITEERILSRLRQTADFLRALQLAGPIAVCGLNPHAGEQGRLGHEEERIIAPAIAKARAQGLDAQGPFAADTIFHRAYLGEFPAVLAMYHDQGLAPLKLAHFGNAVNVTLGLPFVRTSVDHGTGYELVGQDRADITSFLAALDLARRLA